MGGQKALKNLDIVILSIKSISDRKILFMIYAIAGNCYKFHRQFQMEGKEAA